MDVPLQIDSSHAGVIESGLRIYNGKPIVNSVNGEMAVMEKVLPLVKKYGAAVVGLTSVSYTHLVVPNATYSQEVLTRIVTSQAVRYAVDLMKDHSCIGISWGTACYEFMHSFPDDSNLCDITVVPLIGISPLLTREYQLNESVRMFADKLRGNPIFIYSPGIVQDVSDKQRVLESSYMKPILERWDNMDMAVVGIGTTPVSYTHLDVYKRQDLRQSFKERAALIN